jgi:mannose-6-phosphate isomerase-like protein (cupin superfamily)
LPKAAAFAALTSKGDPMAPSLRRCPLVVFVLPVLVSLAFPAVAQDPVEVAPANYTVKVDNGHVRVLEVRLARGVEVPMHSHPERVVYVIQGGSLRVTDEAGRVTDFELTPGQAVALPTESHVLRNTGRRELVLVEVELADTAGLVPGLTTFERAELEAMLERSRDRLDEVVGRAQGAHFAARPAEGRWSVAEVVEHLATSERLIFGLVEQALASPEDSNWRNLHVATTTTELMDNMLDRSRRFAAPEPLQPQGGLGRDEVIAAFHTARARTLDFVRSTAAPVKAHTAAAPVGKLTAHQFLVLIAAHTLRHTAQAEEALAAVTAVK